MNTPARNKLRSERGAALLIALGILLAISLIAVSSVETSRMDLTVAGNQVRRNQALLAAEAGLARTEAVLRERPKEQNAGVLMTEINAASQMAHMSFQVSMESGLPLRKVISVGRGPESEAAIEVMYRYGRNPYNIWNNALFAGRGQNGKAIRGNTGIHGSMHILGNGEHFTDDNRNGRWDPGEPYKDANHDGGYDGPLSADSVALSLGGGASLSNNYDGIPTELRTRVPPLDVFPYKGENVQTLFAELRVQHGQVLLSGSSRVGSSDASGGSPAIKETMDAVWVNDGFGGSGGAASVYSDNGTQERYDFAGGQTPEMPDLDAPFVDADGVSHTSYLNYLKSKALVINGDLNLTYGTVRPLVASSKGSLSLDASGNLTATGIIYVTGDVNINVGGPLQYAGKFMIVSEGNTTVDANLFSKSTFATTDLASVVTHGRLTLGVSASQLKLMGAFFAQEEVRVTKQTQVAGAIVSNYFNLAQVPDIYQVPAILDQLPLDLPGAHDYYAYSWQRVPRSWTELF